MTATAHQKASREFHRQRRIALAHEAIRRCLAIGYADAYFTINPLDHMPTPIENLPRRCTLVAFPDIRWPGPPESTSAKFPGWPALWEIVDQLGIGQHCGGGKNTHGVDFGPEE